MADNIAIGQLAMKFGVSVKTIKRWYFSGKTCLEVWCPEHLIGKRGLCFTKESVAEFMKRSKVSSGSWT